MRALTKEIRGVDTSGEWRCNKKRQNATLFFPCPPARRSRWQGWRRGPRFTLRRIHESEIGAPRRAARSRYGNKTPTSELCRKSVCPQDGAATEFARTFPKVRQPYGGGAWRRAGAVPA